MSHMARNGTNQADSLAETPEYALSVVIPVYNEVENLPILQQQLAATLTSLGTSYEIIYVDDGSTDGSLSGLRGNCPGLMTMSGSSS